MKGQILLLIEDNPSDARLLHEMLRDLGNGYHIIWVKTLAEAQKEIATKQFHLILCDLGLQDSQGFDTASAVIASASNMSIIILTGQDDKGSPVAVEGVVTDITERKRAEDALRESETRLRTLVQTIPDLVWLKDRYGVYLDCNPMFERFFGAAQKDIVGKTDYDFVDRELADFFRENDRKAMAVGKPRSNEEWVSFADDGHRALLDTIKTPMLDANGNLVGILGIARDITKKHRAEEERKAHIFFLESLELVDRAIKEETDVEQMMQAILMRVFSIFDCDRAWLLYPCDPDALSFRVIVEITRPEYPGANVLNVDVPMSPGEAQNMREALDSDEPVVYTAGTKRPISTAKQFGVQSQMFIPVFPKLGNPWVFGMHQCSYPRIWSEEEKRLFKEIGRRVSDGLSSVLFLRELQENEERFRAIFESSSVGMSLKASKL